MQIISKCGIKLMSPQRPDHTIQHYDTSAAHIVASAEQSLRELHTDHLDLLLIHRPDPLMDFDEIAEAFSSLMKAGKVQHVGVSNFTRHQFDSLNRRVKLATNQVEFSPHARGAPVRRNLRRPAGPGYFADDLVAAGGRTPVQRQPMRMARICAR